MIPQFLKGLATPSLFNEKQMSRVQPYFTGAVVFHDISPNSLQKVMAAVVHVCSRSTPFNGINIETKLVKPSITSDGQTYKVYGGGANERDELVCVIQKLWDIRQERFKLRVDIDATVASALTQYLLTQM